MPRTIDDLRMLSKQYIKSTQAAEHTQDEKVYLSYIEEHYLAAARKETEAH